MRKSLLKTPPSALSSRLLSPAALVVGARARRPAPKGDRGAGYADGPRVRVAVEGAIGEEEDFLASRLRLLEGFVSRTDITDCAQFALQWLANVFGVTPSICLLRPQGEQMLYVIGAHGAPGASLSGFTVSAD